MSAALWVLGIIAYLAVRAVIRANSQPTNTLPKGTLVDRNGRPI